MADSWTEKISLSETFSIVENDEICLVGRSEVTCVLLVCVTKSIVEIGNNEHAAILGKDLLNSEGIERMCCEEI